MPYRLALEIQKADRFWFAPGQAEKAGQVRLCSRPCQLHAAHRPQLRAPDLRTLSGNFRKRTSFGSHPERRKRQARYGSAVGLANCMRLIGPVASARPPNLVGELQKADRFWFAPVENKSEFIDHLSEGYVRSSEICCDTFPYLSCYTQHQYVA